MLAALGDAPAEAADTPDAAKDRLFEAVMARLDALVPHKAAVRVLARELPDRKSVVSGKRVSVRVGLGGSRIIKKKIKVQSNFKMTLNTLVRMLYLYVWFKVIDISHIKIRWNKYPPQITNKMI